MAEKNGGFAIVALGLVLVQHSKTAVKGQS